MLLEQLQRRGFEPREDFRVTARMLGEKMRRQGRDVLTPFAQGRDLNFHRVEPEQQVLSEPAGGNLLRKSRVRCTDEAGISLLSLGRTDALEFAGLEHTQQRGLQLQRDIGDFIQEQRAALREFESANTVGLGIREGAADVAEKLVLENTFREPAHVHGDQRFARTRRGGVQRPGDEPFAGPIFPRDEHVGLGWPDATNQIHDGPHRG